MIRILNDKISRNAIETNDEQVLKQVCIKELRYLQKRVTQIQIFSFCIKLE